MGKTTEISWADHTFNPWIGCTKVSPGCAHCYAETLMDKRYGRVRWGKGQPRSRTAPSNWRQPLAWNRAAEKSGAPGRVFCASLADWLDPEVPAEWLADLLHLIRETPHLTWMLLTKRPEKWSDRLHAALASAKGEASDRDEEVSWWLDGEAPSNVWVGTTVEDQQRADERIPALLAIPARVRFLSCEPLLEAVDFDLTCGRSDRTWDDPNGIHWVICGGESGPRARPMKPEWARALRDQCQEAGVAFFFKQWGAWGPSREEVAGRLLDGRTWEELPVGTKPKGEPKC